MKICLACRQRFVADEFRCPRCGHSPELLDGFPAFAPGLAQSNSGFKSDYFASLADLECGSFWFESRNRLLTWALERYFPHTEAFFEIGCGTGFVLSGIKKVFPEIRLFGSDIFSEGIIYAKQRVPQAGFFQMDALRIPFENEFDTIGAFDVIEHIEDDEMVLNQIFKAVKLGGGIILTVPQHRILWSKNDEIACHKRRYSQKDLVAKVENAGFRILRLTSFISFLLPLMVASRLRWRFGIMGKKDRGSELQQPRWINSLLTRICDYEKRFIRVGGYLPVGGSLLCVGSKD